MAAITDRKDDLVVNIGEKTASASKPFDGAIPPAGTGAGADAGIVARAKEWVNSNPWHKWIVGGTVLILLVPVVVGPIAVAQQKGSGGVSKSSVPDWGAYQSAGNRGYFDPLVSLGIWQHRRLIGAQGV
jgi:hypothetical protein